MEEDTCEARLPHMHGNVVPPRTTRHGAAGHDGMCVLSWENIQTAPAWSRHSCQPIKTAHSTHSMDCPSGNEVARGRGGQRMEFALPFGCIDPIDEMKFIEVIIVWVQALYVGGRRR